MASRLTGLRPEWAEPGVPLVLVNGEDERETLEALRNAGLAHEPMGAYRGFAWHRLPRALCCVAGVGPPNEHSVFGPA